MFAEGCALGLESDLNFTNWLPDADKTFQELDQAMNDMDQGLQHRSISQIYRGFEELGDRQSGIRPDL
eukprot:EC794240.1.p5 GENE.EC794240.1~~EC794240.1.p5  ORF type:complete len:68 (+),score=17.41 EC794240.1:250-453(+)